MLHMRPPIRPLIADDSGTVSHVWWKSGALVDTVGNAWTMNGTVPQVPKAGKTPAGAGPFSDANYYSLGTGNDVLDFAGDFSACVVFYGPETLPQYQGLVTNLGATGHAVFLATTSGFAHVYFGSPNAATANARISGAVNVVCWGRSGTTGYVKMNLGSIVTVASVTSAAAATTVARIGSRANQAGQYFLSTIYEVWASTTTASDALFISIMDRVKSRAGVTAW